MAEDPHGEEPNPLVAKCIEEALAPLRRLPPEVWPSELLPDFASTLETFLTTHPEVVTALADLRPRVDEASTGPRAREGAGDASRERVAAKPTGTEGR
jgi:hypothetical protein